MSTSKHPGIFRDYRYEHRRDEENVKPHIFMAKGEEERGGDYANEEENKYENGSHSFSTSVIERPAYDQTDAPPETSKPETALLEMNTSSRTRVYDLLCNTSAVRTLERFQYSTERSLDGYQSERDCISYKIQSEKTLEAMLRTELEMMDRRHEESMKWR
jgi:hypothetical protein